MSKIKILSILVATLFVCSAVASISGAEEIDGNIEVEISQWIGLVTPILNITENQTGLSLKVDKIEGNVSANETDTYRVNDTLSIKINVTDNSERGDTPFLIPRSVFTSVIVLNDDTGLFPLRGFLKRFIRARVSPFSLAGEGRVDVRYGDVLLNVSMDHFIENGTMMENMTMHITVMGVLPGNINGLDGIPVIQHMKINLDEVTYVYPE